MLDRLNSALQVMDPSGHTHISWNPSNQDEVKVAKDTFDTMLGKGYRAFRMEYGGEQGRPMTVFDAKAEKIIMLPQLVGG